MADDKTEVDVNAAMEPLKQLEPLLGSTPLAPAHAIATIALTMAMKYHDINTVQDGTLYQQYKLEGQNMRPLILDEVFATAERIEVWMIRSQDRITKLLIEAIADIVPEGEEPEPPKA